MAREEILRDDLAEASLLGAILLDNEVLGKVADMVSELDFCSAVHRRIYGAMLDMYISGEPIDLVSLKDRLGREHLEKLVELEEVVPAIANAEHYAGIVREKSLRRQVHVEALRLKQCVANADGNVYEIVDGHINKLLGLMDRAGKKLVKLPEAMDETLKELRGERKEGVPAGFGNLEGTIGHFYGGELTILAGRPSMGKSSFARDVVRRLTLRDKDSKILVFTLEESATQYAQNMLISQARVDSHAVRTGVMDGVLSRLSLAKEAFQGSSVYLLDSGTVTIKEIASRARATKSRHGLDLLIVDYLQYVQGEGSNPRERVDDVTNGLKRLARGLNIPVLALAQLSRATETREDHKPRLSDLRESGMIEQTADVVLFIHRAGYYKRDREDNTAEIIVAKQRHGPAGVSVRFTFEKEYMRFEED
ncbi:MAG: replicative DNA helicase [Candidatus Brocadiales bacterium]